MGLVVTGSHPETGQPPACHCAGERLLGPVGPCCGLVRSPAQAPGSRQKSSEKPKSGGGRDPPGPVSS